VHYKMSTLPLVIVVMAVVDTTILSLDVEASQWQTLPCCHLCKGSPGNTPKCYQELLHCRLGMRDPQGAILLSARRYKAATGGGGND